MDLIWTIRRKNRSGKRIKGRRTHNESEDWLARNYLQEVVLVSTNSSLYNSPVLVLPALNLFKQPKWANGSASCSPHHGRIPAPNIYAIHVLARYTSDMVLSCIIPKTGFRKKGDIPYPASTCIYLTHSSPLSSLHSYTFRRLLLHRLQVCISAGTVNLHLKQAHDIVGRRRPMVSFHAPV
jgi:hypothetical protein